MTLAEIEPTQALSERGPTNWITEPFLDAYASLGSTLSLTQSVTNKDGNQAQMSVYIIFVSLSQSQCLSLGVSVLESQSRCLSFGVSVSMSQSMSQCLSLLVSQSLSLSVSQSLCVSVSQSLSFSV